MPQLPLVGDRLSHKVGPLPVWGWGAVVVGGLGVAYYLRKHGGVGSGSSSKSSGSGQSITLNPVALGPSSTSSPVGSDSLGGGGGGGVSGGQSSQAGPPAGASSGGIGSTAGGSSSGSQPAAAAPVLTGQPTQGPSQQYTLPSGKTFLGTPGGMVLPGFGGQYLFFGPQGGPGTPVS
jgi:hypothetical protein